MSEQRRWLGGKPDQASQPMPPPPGQPGPRPMPVEEDMALIRARLRLFLLLVLGLFIVMTQRLPFRLAGIALAIVALVIGIRLLRMLRRLRREGRRAPGAFTLITGITLSTILLFLLVADAVYYPLVADLEDCQAGANTEVARDLCQREADSRIDEILERFTERANRDA